MKSLKLEKIDISRLRNSEFGQFMTRLFEDVAKANLDLDTDSDFKRLFEQLKSQSVTFDKALEQTYVNEESKKIGTLDKVRGTDFQSLKDSIYLHRNAKTEARKEAYNALKIILGMYKKVKDEPYEEETKKLNTLLSILKSETAATHVATLGVGEYVTELEKSNTAFNEVFGRRSYQNSQKVTYDIRKLRKEAKQVYKTMAEYLLNLAKVKQNPFYSKMLDIFNNIRKYYADVIARRTRKNPSVPNNDINN